MTDSYVPQYPFVNGTVWEAGPGWRRILMYLSDNQWGLLSLARHIAGWPAVCLNFQHLADGRYSLSEEEMKRHLIAEGYQCLGFWYGPDYPRTIKEELSEKDFQDVQQTHPDAARGADQLTGNDL